jgi:hypothetical protein
VDASAGTLRERTSVDEVDGTPGDPQTANKAQSIRHSVNEQGNATPELRAKAASVL